jgi:uncharacterized protein YbaA (DUF1428 family)
MQYVLGTVIPVPVKKLAAYRALARKGAAVWKKYGALSVMECAADDVKPGKLTSFPQAVKLKRGEKVILSFIIFKSKRDHDRIWKLVMKDPFMPGYDMTKAPFDPKRMFWGAFKPIVAV